MCLACRALCFKRFTIRKLRVFRCYRYATCKKYLIERGLLWESSKGKSLSSPGGTRGIGFGIVEKFLAEGAKVALFGSRQETVDAALEKIKQNNPEAPVMGLHPALTDPDEIAAAFKSVVDTFGSLDILANNAGTDSRTKLVDYTLEEFQKVMRLNVEATFVCSQAAARIMIEQGTGGAIINTSSMVSIYGQPAWMRLSHLEVRQ